MGKKFMGLSGTDHFWDRAKAWILDQITSAVKEIADIIPSDASASNKLVTADKLDEKQDFRIFKSLEEFNEKKGTSLTVVSGIDNMKDIANAMSNGEILIFIIRYDLDSEVYFGLTASTGRTKMFTFVKSNGLCDVECRTTYPLTLKRVLNSDGVVGDWQELATTDSTLKTIQLSGSVDCNTLTEPGLYTAASAGAVISVTNTPANISSAIQLDGGFSVLVTKTNVDNVYYGMQMFIPYGSDVPFIRKAYYLNGQYWTPWQQLVTESDLSIKKIDISASGSSTSYSATIPLSMAQRNKPFYLEVLSVGDNLAVKEMKYLVFVSSVSTSVATKEISKDSIFTNVSITFNADTGCELSFSSTSRLYSTVVYIQQ